MATITTAFNIPTVSRSRADRSSAGVVAGYIRELAAAPVQAGTLTTSAAASGQTTAPQSASAAADAIGAAYIGAARGRSGEGAARRSPSRGRGGCAHRAKRMLESR